VIRTLARPLVCLVCLFASIDRPAAAPADVWAPLQFLVGRWVGEGSGQPGQGVGPCSFAFELDRRVLVRRSRVEYPATAARPAFVHEDLMIHYRQGEALRAIYFDNEDHVIEYTGQLAADNQGVTFVTSASAPGPRFRLSYAKRPDGTLAVKFEIAPPGKPDAFAVYTEGVARRVK